MPGITEEMFEEGAITADYNEVEALTLKFTDLLSKAKTAKIIKEGHILQMWLENRKGIPVRGYTRILVKLVIFLLGRAYIAPKEDSAYGSMIIDGSMVGVGILKISTIYRG